MRRKRLSGRLLCLVCKRAFPDEAFRLLPNHGKLQRDSYCIECRNAYSKACQAAWRKTPEGREISNARARVNNARVKQARREDHQFRASQVASALAELKQKGLNRTKIAERIGVSYYTVRKWDHGTVPQSETLRKLRRLVVQIRRVASP